MIELTKIISGGQSGVDRGAIGAALHGRFHYGGKVPRGREAEDGVVPACFTEMVESTGGYPVRTRENVEESDATLILNNGPVLSGGTLFTVEVAQKNGTPLLVLNVHQIRRWSGCEENAEVSGFFRGVLVDQIEMWLGLRWLGLQPVRTLNVAGPRESKAPGMERLTYDLVLALIERIREDDKKIDHCTRCTWVGQWDSAVCPECRAPTMRRRPGPAVKQEVR